MSKLILSLNSKLYVHLSIIRVQENIIIIGDLSETHRRHVGDPSETYLRPFGDPSETDMQHRRAIED